jgi:orotidine-5'-phosphate decarboxylase
LILALDVATREEALALARSTGDHVGYMKVGLRLFTSEGPGIVRDLQEAGLGVFLDLKLHDIPNTVADAARAAAALRVDFFTIHTAGGTEMMRAALAASRDEARGLGVVPPQILAVTVLTSLPSTTEEVVARARGAWEAGITGVVASPREARAIRDALGPGAVIVTPGIRPSWAATNDQKRISTPADAVAAGADYIVVGRPIRNADDPEEAARLVVSEMELTEVGG